MLRNVITTMILLCLFLSALIIFNMLGLKESVNLFFSMLLLTIAMYKFVSTSLYSIGSIIMLLGILICIQELWLFASASLGCASAITLLFIQHYLSKRSLTQSPLNAVKTDKTSIMQQGKFGSA